MATSLKSREFVLFLITLALVVVMSSEARLAPDQFSTMDRKANRELRFRELINNIRNNESHHRERSMLGARLERVSPQGPDSQHH